MAKRRPQWTSGLLENESLPEELRALAPLVQKRVSETLRLLLGNRLSLQDAFATCYLRALHDVADAQKEQQEVGG